MAEYHTCIICGKSRQAYEMIGQGFGGESRWTCDPARDPDCLLSRPRTFEPFAGWRREQGLEPYDGQPGSPALRHDDGRIAFLVHEDCYLVVRTYCKHCNHSEPHERLAGDVTLAGDLVGDHDECPRCGCSYYVAETSIAFCQLVY